MTVHILWTNCNGSSNNLPGYLPNSHQSHNAVYWRTGLVSWWYTDLITTWFIPTVKIIDEMHVSSYFNTCMFFWQRLHSNNKYYNKILLLLLLLLPQLLSCLSLFHYMCASMTETGQHTTNTITTSTTTKFTTTTTTTRVPDLRSRRLWVWLPSWSLNLNLVTAWMGDCLQTGKARGITNTKVNSAFHPFGVGRSSTGLSGWG